MTTKEFSDEFDVLIGIHNVSNGTNLSFDEYEKSILLTEAQEMLVKSLYDGSATGDALESTEELRKYLDSLIKTDTPENIPHRENECISSKSKLYKLKDDVWFIIYEWAKITDSNCNDGEVQVIPMKHDDWHRSKYNPFRRPNKNRIIRLDFGESISELVSEYSIESYKIRYLSKPTPIVLLDLEEGLEIDGESNITQCKLHTALHRTILEYAVKLAIAKTAKASK